MSLSVLNTGAISFKKLSGKAHTQQNFAVTEEGIATNVQLSYSTVFAQKIEPLPVTNSGLTTLYSTNGIVQRVKFQIDLIPNTQVGTNQSQGYRLKLPADWNTYPGALYPQFVAGTYNYTALGKLQVVPSLYGMLKIDGTTEYDPILYQTDGSTVITKFDPINWYFDPYDGVLFVQNPPAGYDVNASRPGYLEAFLFVGDYVDDILLNTSSGTTGTTGMNVGGGIGIYKNNISNVLVFKTIYGGSGVSIIDSTNNIGIIFTGSTGTLTGATNGLSIIGKNVALGGILTGNTTIDGIQTHGLTLDNFSSFVVNAYDGSTESEFNMSPGDASLSVSNGGGHVTGIEITPTGVQIQTTQNFPFNGITYDTNYQTGFTKYSLVDKNYVTGLTSSAGLASNGLNKVGQYITLGGELTGDTTVELTGHTLNLINTTSLSGFAGILFNPSAKNIDLTTRGIDNGSISIETDNVGITLTEYTGGTDTIIINGIPSFAGIQYDQDYSANYIPRSLIDKAYADSIAAGLNPKEAVLVATISDLGAVYIATGGTTSTGSFINAPTSIDGILLSVSNRILVKNQIDTKQNGIYVVINAITGIWYRSSDMDGTPINEVSSGDFLFVQTGTTLSATGWVLTGDGILTINIDSLNFVQFSAGNSYLAGDGIEISGNTINNLHKYDNGLIKIGNNIQWGGNLINDTFIDSIGSYTLSVGVNNPLNAFIVKTENDITLQSHIGKIKLLASSGITISGNTNFGGVKYVSDYSINYTSRSLVDYGFLTNQLNSYLLKFNFNIYSGITLTNINSRLLTSVFNSYSASTNTAINNRLLTSLFNSYSATTLTNINLRLLSSSFNSYSATTNTAINNKLSTSSFNIYSGTTLTNINSRLLTSAFNIYSGTTLPSIYAKLTNANLINPSANTITIGDNTQRIATTAFVQNEIEKTIVSTASTSTYNIDLSTGRIFDVTLNTNVTLNYSNSVIGKQYTLIIRKKTTNKTLSWTASKFYFQHGLTPATTDPTTNGTTSPIYSVDIYTLFCSETNKIMVAEAVNWLLN